MFNIFVKYFLSFFKGCPGWASSQWSLMFLLYLGLSYIDSPFISLDLCSRSGREIDNCLLSNRRPDQVNSLYPYWFLSFSNFDPLSLSLFYFTLCLSLSLFMSLSIYRTIYLSLSFFVYVFVYLFFDFFVSLFCFSLCFFVSLFVSLSLCFSLSLFRYLCLSLITLQKRTSKAHFKIAHVNEP